MLAPPKCLESTAADTVGCGVNRHHREEVARKYARKMNSMWKTILGITEMSELRDYLPDTFFSIATNTHKGFLMLA